MTWWCDGRDRGANGDAGFTLIELLVVLLILGLVAGLFASYPMHRSRALDLKAAVSEVAAELRLARAQAIARNQPVALVLDLAGHRYGIDGGRPRTLPPNLSIELLTITGERQDAAHGGIQFNPDGSSTGGRVSLADGRRRIDVGVDWLTGKVTVADAGQ